jgi:hypothetical protein
MKMKLLLAATCAVASSAASAGALPVPQLLSNATGHATAVVSSLSAAPSLAAVPRFAGATLPSLAVALPKTAAPDALPGLPVHAYPCGPRQECVTANGVPAFAVVDLGYAASVRSWEQGAAALEIGGLHQLVLGIQLALRQIENPCDEGCSPLKNPTNFVAGLSSALPGIITHLGDGAIGSVKPTPNPPSPVDIFFGD